MNNKYVKSIINYFGLILFTLFILPIIYVRLYLNSVILLKHLSDLLVFVKSIQFCILFLYGGEKFDQ